MTTVYIHYVLFLSFQFNFRKTLLCRLMLKATYFFWLWVSWVSFACWFLVLLNCCYFFFFFYSCTIVTIGTTTTITSNNVSEGKGTSETNYKLWSFEFQSFQWRKERAAPKLVLQTILGLGSTYTHTHTHTSFDCNTRFALGDTTPHTFTFLVHAFWG
jgi:hypothetical protein